MARGDTRGDTLGEVRGDGEGLRREERGERGERENENDGLSNNGEDFDRLGAVVGEPLVTGSSLRIVGGSGGLTSLELESLSFRITTNHPSTDNFFI
jgi:hypothetical protein